MATPNDGWSNRKVTATVVDTEPPPSTGWSSWSPNESPPSAWSTRKKPQRAPRRLSRPAEPTARAVAQSRPWGRWLVAAALWALAGGLFAGRSIAGRVDAGVEVGMDWLAVRGPVFLRPYLPQPVPKLIEPRPHRQGVASPAPTDAPKETARAAAKGERGRRHR